MGSRVELQNLNQSTVLLVQAKYSLERCTLQGPENEAAFTHSTFALLIWATFKIKDLSFERVLQLVIRQPRIWTIK